MGMQEQFENRSSSAPPTVACNLWTQVLHANRIKALTARPETDDVRCLAPIGVAFGVPNEDRCRPGVLQDVALREVGRLHHRDH